MLSVVVLLVDHRNHGHFIECQLGQLHCEVPGPSLSVVRMVVHRALRLVDDFPGRWQEDLHHPFWRAFVALVRLLEGWPRLEKLRLFWHGSDNALGRLVSQLLWSALAR
jgi:hypothetical protein